MKSLMVILYMFFGSLAVELPTIRAYFVLAKDSQSITEKLYNELAAYSQNDPVVLAYKGASQILKARLLKDRSAKKALVVQGIQLLERSVEAAPEEVEIRLVRLAIQEHAPKILKYNGHMAEDKRMILANFATQPTVVRTIISQYAAQSKYFTAGEQAKLAE
ncbi:MAG: hypothetical protein ACTJHT_01475 [Sphingobacterium sp.]|uniref:hypothetical protein n=1 Tax=Sphingobacterium sp. JB170 TaxID=1434842 RepID=UPI00097EE7F4|nr:hypothetical protein [Sphingobacterium sp. JB170]SJN44289.1 hypothetical protein FM107_12820 [Sphingobacterium sp. JB170]